MCAAPFYRFFLGFCLTQFVSFVRLPLRSHCFYLPARAVGVTTGKQLAIPSALPLRSQTLFCQPAPRRDHWQSLRDALSIRAIRVHFCPLPDLANYQFSIINYQFIQDLANFQLSIINSQFFQDLANFQFSIINSQFIQVCVSRSDK